MVSGEKSTESCPYFVVDAKTFKRYSPDWLYLRRLLKQSILAAENDGEEVLDDLYEPHASSCFLHRGPHRFCHFKLMQRLALISSSVCYHLVSMCFMSIAKFQVLDNFCVFHVHIYLKVSNLTSRHYLQQQAPVIPLRRYKSFSYSMPAKARAHLALKTCSMKESEDSGELIILRVPLNMLEGDTGYG